MHHIFIVKFSYCLDDILKQFKMVGSLKEQQVQSHKRTQRFILGNPHGRENPAKLPQIELNQNSVKPQKQILLSF